jgi:hypothetical protein
MPLPAIQRPAALPTDTGLTSGLTRKPVGRATSVDGTASNERRRTYATGALGHASENRQHRVGIAVSEADRETILQQLFRCLGKYDPRAIPRIIAKRTGITEQAVDYVLQQTCREFQIWRHEIELALARANEAATAVWQRRSERPDLVRGRRHEFR